MSARGLEIAPLSVALRGEQGSIAYFECKLKSERGSVSVWATCGQRRRFPVPARVIADEAGDTRRVIATVHLPAEYSACTLHVIVRDGVRVSFGSCRVPDERFRALAASANSADNDLSYHDWFCAHKADEDELARQRERVGEFAIRPLISIVTPIYRTPEPYLTAFIDSVLAQTYPDFELVLVNVSGTCPEVDAVLARYVDERVRVIAAPNKTIPENTNAGIEVARGDFIGFIDHDDFIEPDAFFRYVEAINDCPECDLLFCDEDLWDPDFGGGRFCGARFKPGWNPDLLYTHNYVCHLLMVSRQALSRVEPYGPQVNGAQDYDLTLKVAEVARAIRHVPGILYHWRRHAGSTALNRESKPYALEAGRIAVQAHFDRVGIDAEVTYGTAPFSYKVDYALPDARDVSIILVDADSDAPPIACGQAPALGGAVELLGCGAGAIDDAIRGASTSLVVVLDTTAQVRGSGWLSELVGPLARLDVGCTAPLLANADGFVYSAGMVSAGDGVWRHSFAGYPASDMGYMYMLEHARDVGAAPSCCLAFRKADYEKVGGFGSGASWDARAVAFCERVGELGLRVVLVPYELVVTTRKQPEDAWVACDGADPYFNRFLDQRRADYRLGE